MRVKSIKSVTIAGLTATAALAGCTGSHHRHSSAQGLTPAERTDLQSRLLLAEHTGVSVRPQGPTVIAATPAQLLAHPELAPALYATSPNPQTEGAALQAGGFVSAAGEALVDPVVNVHSTVIRFRAPIDADRELRRIAGADARGRPQSRFTVKSIPGSIATTSITRIPGAGRARTFRLLFADGSYLYGEQIESVPSPEVKGKFVAATTGLYRGVRGRLGP